MYIQRYGILSQTQGGATPSRPSQYIQCAANGMLRTSDNAGDPFNFGAKTNKSFTVAGWFNIPVFNQGTNPNQYTEGFFGHGSEYSYMVRLYKTANTGGFYTTDFNTQQYSFSENTWYFFFCTLSDTANQTIWRVYDTSANLFSKTLNTTNNVITDTVDYFYLGASRGRSYWGGTIGCQSRFNAVGVWNTNLSTSDADALWNNGAGLSYADLSAGQKTGLVAYWNCDNYSVGAVNDNHTNGYIITAQNSANVSLQTI